MLVILLLHFLPISLKDSTIQLKDQLVNTRWEHKVAVECSDSLVFRPNHKMRDYTCELDEWFEGSYSLIKDTLTIKVINDTEEPKKLFRTKYLYKGDRVSFISRERYYKGKWTMSDSVADQEYFYKKVEKK